MRALLKTLDNPTNFTADTIVVPVFADKKLSTSAKLLNKAQDNALTTLIRNDAFKGKKGELLALPITKNASCKRIVLWGLGEKGELTRQLWGNACAALAKNVGKKKGQHVGVIGDFKTGRSLPADWCLQQLVSQLTQSSYSYTHTKKSANKAAADDLAKITVINADDSAANKRAIKNGLAIGEGVNVARNLGNLPGNICTPKYLSSEARKLARKYPAVSTKILGERQMDELGMGSLLSVGHGSVQESQLIIMEYKGGKKGDAPHVLVGKGITFDSGGISLKPGGKMDEMKFDMCGAASVVGTVTAAAQMKLGINLMGVIPAAENMPSSTATKPGDVVTSMAGKTIEVLNTDAEGRLVLCDALHYVKRFKPQSVVDIATLTGACIVALGHHASGLLANNDELADDLLAAGTQSADRAWRLPIWDEYQKQLQTPFADLANIGGAGAGTITAACFLSQFAEDYPWAHLDIAGTAWNQGGGKGASGRPVSMLCQYLMNKATAK
jgi:leucyl aminopeptidase